MKFCFFLLCESAEEIDEWNSIYIIIIATNVLKLLYIWNDLIHEHIINTNKCQEYFDVFLLQVILQHVSASYVSFTTYSLSLYFQFIFIIVF